MRISDWSSDVCSSDLLRRVLRDTGQSVHGALAQGQRGCRPGDSALEMVALGADDDALCRGGRVPDGGTRRPRARRPAPFRHRPAGRSEEHTSELQSLMRISYAVFRLQNTKKKIIEENNNKKQNIH